MEVPPSTPQEPPSAIAGSTTEVKQRPVDVKAGQKKPDARGKGKKRNAESDEEATSEHQPKAKAAKSRTGKAASTSKAAAVNGAEVAKDVKPAEPAKPAGGPGPNSGTSTPYNLLAMAGMKPTLSLSGMKKIQKGDTKGSSQMRPATAAGLEAPLSPAGGSAAPSPKLSLPPPTGPKVVSARPLGPTPEAVRKEMEKRVKDVESSKFDLLRQSIEMQEFDDMLNRQRKVWLGDIPEDKISEFLPNASIARDPKPKSLPYPMQFGSGFWLCADQPAPVSTQKSR